MIFTGSLDNTALFDTHLEKPLYLIEIFLADDRLVVIQHEVAVHLTVIRMTLELAVGKGFLEHGSAVVLFVCENTFDGRG